MLVCVKAAVVPVIAPATASDDAMSTAPSMSTTSRLVVPSTSMSPEMSRLANTEVPVAVTVPVTSMPVQVVARLAALLWKMVTAPPVEATILFALFAALFISRQYFPGGR